MTPEQLAARWLADEPCFDLLQTRPIATMQQEVSGEWMRYDDALAAIARHLAPEDDLVEQATAALEGVTGGPWRAEGEPWNQIVWSGAENRVCFMAHSNGLDDGRDIATARFIAFTRQWVPEAAARIAALTSTVAELEATVAEVTSDRAYIIGANAGWEAAVEHGQATPAAQAVLACANAAEAEVSRLRDRLARMEGDAEWQDKQRRDAFARRHMNAPEDPHVYVLCERYGYGAVMDAASRLWARKDSMGAFYIGGCIGIKPDDTSEGENQ